MNERYDPPLPQEYPQCKICDCYLEQDYSGEYYCPDCENEDEDEEAGES